MSEVTEILEGISRGEELATDRLMPLVYEELRRIARSRMAHERSDHTLQPTALVHEAYLRLIGNKDQSWEGRRHFLGAAAEAMRRILVERARRRQRLKHGGGRQRADIDLAWVAENPSTVDLLALDEVLAQFEAAYPDKAKVVKLRYFAGLSVPEVAEAMDISVATAERYWSFARGWLFAELKSADDPRKPGDSC